MFCAREKREELERLMVGGRGVLSADSRGRERPEAPDEIRTCFQRDIDRIIHSKAFRRLKHKTQVFLQPEGDHYRTRLSHTLEVARIARTISRALRLNEDLTEAVALGHDLGHTPFGHAGERALDAVFREGFRHYEQSLRVVDRLEKSGDGLNLCYETRMGILSHKHGSPGDTVEAAVVRISDRIAYINHDVDDAVRAGIITVEDLPFVVLQRIGDGHSERINAIISDLVRNSADGEIRLSDDMEEAVAKFRDFLFEAVYLNPKAKAEEAKVPNILWRIWDHYTEDPGKLPDDYKRIVAEEGKERAVCDYISGMTDDFAVAKFTDIYVPSPWHVK